MLGRILRYALSIVFIVIVAAQQYIPEATESRLFDGFFIAISFYFLFAILPDKTIKPDLTEQKSVQKIMAFFLLVGIYLCVISAFLLKSHLYG